MDAEANTKLIDAMAKEHLKKSDPNEYMQLLETLAKRKE